MLFSCVTSHTFVSDEWFACVLRLMSSCCLLVQSKWWGDPIPFYFPSQFFMRLLTCWATPRTISPALDFEQGYWVQRHQPPHSPSLHCMLLGGEIWILGSQRWRHHKGPSEVHAGECTSRSSQPRALMPPALWAASSAGHQLTYWGASWHHKECLLLLKPHLTIAKGQLTWCRSPSQQRVF